ncbi:hypothetical protein G6N74_28490 [Mesorhizobium sp. CGMCC 1.15528]|uniref:Uncharacterized protein n=1 Tax=Mesorhizobium zhangyense TaxID=1776730 RepID=A0A7C9RCA4_9HYPH|nr:hypothetical protein [Mesorhizobium zhangyense]NGN44999.1 hypothetical protein [Mesorhizobium zhangyense]
MRLATNWRAVLRHAWSIRLIFLAALLSGAEVSLPLLEEWMPVPAGVFAALSFITTAGAFIARLIVQKDLSDEKSPED